MSTLLRKPIVHCACRLRTIQYLRCWCYIYAVNVLGDIIQTGKQIAVAVAVAEVWKLCNVTSSSQGVVLGLLATFVHGYPSGI